MGAYMAPLTKTVSSRTRIRVGNVWLDPLREREVISLVREAWTSGCGGSVMTVNADIARAGAVNPLWLSSSTAGHLFLQTGCLWSGPRG